MKRRFFVICSAFLLVALLIATFTACDDEQVDEFKLYDLERFSTHYSFQNIRIVSYTSDLHEDNIYNDILIDAGANADYDELISFPKGSQGSTLYSILYPATRLLSSIGRECFVYRDATSFDGYLGLVESEFVSLQRNDTVELKLYVPENKQKFIPFDFSANNITMQWRKDDNRLETGEPYFTITIDGIVPENPDPMDEAESYSVTLEYREQVAEDRSNAYFLYEHMEQNMSLRPTLPALTGPDVYHYLYRTETTGYKQIEYEDVVGLELNVYTDNGETECLPVKDDIYWFEKDKIYIVRFVYTGILEHRISVLMGAPVFTVDIGDKIQLTILADTDIEFRFDFVPSDALLVFEESDNVSVSVIKGDLTATSDGNIEYHYVGGDAVNSLRFRNFYQDKDVQVTIYVQAIESSTETTE